MQTVQLTQEQSQHQTQSQHIAPYQIQANLMLQCSAQELVQMIVQEQQQNPALEAVDLHEENRCSLCPPYGLCSECASQQERPVHEGNESMDADTAGDDSSGHEVHNEHHLLLSEWEQMRCDIGSSSGPAESDFDPLLLARAPTSLADELLLHLRASSSTPLEATIAEYLVNCLDDQGYLRLDIDDACETLHIPCALIMEGVQRLQSCDPPGIGARDLRECLLLQICARRENDDPEEYDAVAELILRNHWTKLIRRRQMHIARSLGISAQRLKEAIDFIQHRLTPYPAAQFRLPWEHCPNTVSMSVRPDVVIRRTQTGFAVDVIGLEDVDLQINPEYQRLYENIRAQRADPAAVRGKLSEYDRHIITYVERAEIFLRNLQQRCRTIQRITQFIVEAQQGFLETGRRVFLRPMTRTRIATELGIHESTVSRALQYKFVQLPSQDVVAYEIFFENAVSAKDAVTEIIDQESSDDPLTDQALTDLLNQRGFSVARRTVVKYREELRIPASYLRRQR